MNELRRRAGSLAGSTAATTWLLLAGRPGLYIPRLTQPQSISTPRYLATRVILRSLLYDVEARSLSRFAHRFASDEIKSLSNAHH